MRTQIVRTRIIPLAAGLLTLGTGCATSEESSGGEATVVVESTPVASSASTTARIQPLGHRVIAFVSYYDDAAHTNLVGGATFSQCPGDPSWSWGAQTEFHTIESEPCGGDVAAPQ